MQKLALIICCFLLVSCDLFDSKKVSPEEIVREEMKSINWNDVDHFPIFPSCDETANRQAQQLCFQQEFTEQIYRTLSKHQLVVRKRFQDTVKVQLLIDSKGKISIISINKSEETEKMLPALDGLIELAVNRMPKVYPALKRNIPVNTRVVMPVVLKMD
ncbi:energy transducer TonB [Robertkochia sediminum]|uniref:hypothetical protein n=1 Tax=Robertkochia sediminum TaxID=2785326 RepID=UPI001934405D|nr:hypothetical protein [Robertkochia sediminum]MBL7473878.1 hypothetical protein [Robertkochia sediminum]